MWRGAAGDLIPYSGCPEQQSAVSLLQRQAGRGSPSNGNEVLQQVVLTDGRHAAGRCGLLQEAQIHLYTTQACQPLGNWYLWLIQMAYMSCHSSMT